jgi:D-alanyl-D-alanine carboxypeptidase (penicillin-binding protein 5/6)
VIRHLLAAALALFLLPALGAQDLAPEAPSAVLLDQLTGRILFQKQPDLAIPPASLTKLMTLHLAWKALAEGRVTPDTEVPITAATTGASVPPGSSLMFLEPGQKVSFRELMLGLAVDSGNDAGLTLAGYLGGSQPAFVVAMNLEAAALGLLGTVFYDSYGYDARNRTTAGDFAKFSRSYLAAHPQSVQVLHNVRQLAFPLAENRAPNDRRPARTIVQANRNTLLGAYPGADGLKTGFIEESGYNLAATALRGDQRLVVVILGVRGRTTEEGGRLRTAAAVRLLDFGFDLYPLRPLTVPEAVPVRLWYSETPSLVPAPSGPTVYPLSSDEAALVQVRREGPSEVRGPLAAGQVLGRLVWSKEGRDFYTVNLVAPRAVGLAPWWSGLWDRIVLFFRGLTGVPAPPALTAAAPRT